MNKILGGCLNNLQRKSISRNYYNKHLFDFNTNNKFKTEENLSVFLIQKNCQAKRTMI